MAWASTQSALAITVCSAPPDPHTPQYFTHLPAPDRDFPSALHPSLQFRGERASAGPRSLFLSLLTSRPRPCLTHGSPVGPRKSLAHRGHLRSGQWRWILLLEHFLDRDLTLSLISSSGRLRCPPAPCPVPWKLGKCWKVLFWPPSQRTCWLPSFVSYFLDLPHIDQTSMRDSRDNRSHILSWPWKVFGSRFRRSPQQVAVGALHYFLIAYLHASLQATDIRTQPRNLSLWTLGHSQFLSPHHVPFTEPSLTHIWCTLNPHNFVKYIIISISEE